MPSFDVVSKLNMHEVDNAVEQASKEVSQRYDFKGTDSKVEKNEEGITLNSDTQAHVAAILQVLQQKLAKRGVSLKSLDIQTAQASAGSRYKQVLKLKEGVNKDEAKKIVKTIKDAKLKVQASIQGDTVRVTGKKRDDLQEVITMLKGSDLGLPLQYENFRD